MGFQPELNGFVLCPACRGRLTFGKKIVCVSCDRNFKTEAKIPLLYWPEDGEESQKVSTKVKDFYETTPFPNYDEVDSSATLREKIGKGLFVKLLDEQIPSRAKVLDVGCGTGQLSNILGSTAGRSVYAVDICLNSLKLAEEFRKKNKVPGTRFLQMNIFRPVFNNKSFDYVICNGVLHHTANPELGFKILARLAKKGGYLVVGLYNKYGRLATNLRRLFFKFSGDKFLFLDPVLRRGSISKIKRDTWFRDQYQNPNEFKHTFDEVLGWFKKEGIKFEMGIPDPSLFAKAIEGSRLEHLLVQLGMVFADCEGGFFVMVGRKI